MLKIPYWINVHKLLTRYQGLIFKLFIVAYALGFSLIGLGFYLYNALPEVFALIYEAGHLIGTVALGLFLTTLIPGILGRFKIFPLFSASIVLFRRQIGILMFIVALIHSFYLNTIPAIMTSTLGPEFMETSDVIGSVALMILLPVWLTSNDFSQKSFGRFWKTIQRLTYFALIAIFVHVALHSFKLGLIALIVFIFEAASWIKVWFFDKKSGIVGETAGEVDQNIVFQ